MLHPRLWTDQKKETSSKYEVMSLLSVSTAVQRLIISESKFLFTSGEQLSSHKTPYQATDLNPTDLLQNKQN